MNLVLLLVMALVLVAAVTMVPPSSGKNDSGASLIDFWAQVSSTPIDATALEQTIAFMIPTRLAQTAEMAATANAELQALRQAAATVNTQNTLDASATAMINATIDARLATAAGATWQAAVLTAVPNAALHNADWTPIIGDFGGVEMVMVPAGCFLMGGEYGSDDQTLPANRVCFTNGFWIDRYEVTNEQFARLNGVARVNGSFTGDNQSRESINWFAAQTFCEQQRGLRLPTESEWEYAARGPDNLTYPWGNDFNLNNVVTQSNSNQSVADVGSRPGDVSWVGVFDLGGNVREWTNTIYDQDLFPYPYATDDGREVIADTSSRRVVRGGAWDRDEANVASALRDGRDSIYESSSLGFRCAGSLAPGEGQSGSSVNRVE